MITMRRSESRSLIWVNNNRMLLPSSADMPSAERGPCDGNEAATPSFSLLLEHKGIIRLRPWDVRSARPWNSRSPK